MGPRSFAGQKVQGKRRHWMPMTPTDGLAICANTLIRVSDPADESTGLTAIQTS